MGAVKCDGEIREITTKGQNFGLFEVDPFTILDVDLARLNAFLIGLRQADW
jgi:hypothetical protein